MFNREIVDLMLSNVPGPSPWYLRRKISTTSGIFTWTGFTEKLESSGISRLQNPMHKDILLLGHYCYVKLLSNSRILLWHVNTKYDTPAPGNHNVDFHIVNITTLPPFDNIQKEAAQMKKEKGYCCYSGKPDSYYSCNTLLSPGIHNLVDVPSGFSKLEEILVLGDYDPEDDSVKSDSKIHEAIFAFNFSNNQVEVIPQDWFNNGDYDFGYQWITRVVRDPQTQRIFGDGIRLARFQLDETGRNREQSISQMSVLRALLNKTIDSYRKRLNAFAESLNLRRS